jgi:hypothetical protein
MSLKLKSFIYRKTGIYLASKEELAYIKSREFWKDFLKILGKDATNLGDVQGLLIGMWQAHHGFTRPYNRKRERKKLENRMAKRVKEKK